MLPGNKDAFEARGACLSKLVAHRSVLSVCRALLIAPNAVTCLSSGRDSMYALLVDADYVQTTSMHLGKCLTDRLAGVTFLFLFQEECPTAPKPVQPPHDQHALGKSVSVGCPLCNSSCHRACHLRAVTIFAKHYMVAWCDQPACILVRGL